MYREERDEKVVHGGVLQPTLAGLGERRAGQVRDDLVKRI
jgi:hypothetical protein